MTVNGTFLLIGALLGGTGVLLGAFGAHALKATLGPDHAGTWDTAVTYQMSHALAIVLVALLQRALPHTVLPTTAGWLFLAGVLLFSGSLYALALGGPRWLGPVTPLGGVAFVAGWSCLAIAGWQKLG